MTSRSVNGRTLASDEGIQRGWRFGREDFFARLLDRLEAKTWEHHRAVERSETEAPRAERIARKALAELGWADKNWRSGARVTRTK